MHSISLPEPARQAMRARRMHRTGLNAYRGANTALLVIDMQNMFVAPAAPLEVPAARNICGQINRLANVLRAAGGSVIWVTTTLPAAGSDRDWIYLTDFLSPDRAAQVRQGLRPGSPHFALWEGLDPHEGDLRVAKDRFSPFSPGACDLHSQLQARQIENLLIAGTLTNICCESTARDAMMLNYRVTVVEDANAARSDKDHLAGLWSVAQVFADLATTEEVENVFC